MKPLLDEDARRWLAEIEERKLLLEKTIPLLTAEIKRREKLKSPKFQKEADAAIAELEARKRDCETFVAEETAAIFQCLFGIQEGVPATLQDAEGKALGGLIVQDMTARLLSDGSAVFTVAGDSLSADLLPGLPTADYLLAEESKGQRFVALS